MAREPQRPTTAITTPDAARPRSDGNAVRNAPESAAEREAPAEELPLAGIRVLDFTIAMAGPLATQRLGDLGADVIKVESFGGDLTRVFRLCGVDVNGETTSYLALNRNKRAIALNLKCEDGREVVRRLVRDADVVLQNFRPGVAERLGIGYEHLSAINQRIVYVSISGYGETGPLRHAPGQDLLVQSFSGMLYSAGAADSYPHPAPSYVVDTCASHLATSAVLAGLVQRNRTGRGRHARVSLLGAALEIQCQEVLTYLRTGELAPRGRAPYASVWLEPPYGVYQTADTWIALSQNDNRVIAEVVNSSRMLELVEAQPDRKQAARAQMLKWRDEMHATLQAALRARPTAEWVERLSSRGVWCGAVLSYAEALQHPQMLPFLGALEYQGEAVRCVGPTIDFGGDERPMRSPPRLGENTDEILQQAGWTEADIARLHQTGVVR
jgi:crotonobetainyl-CoA:carnitine CoA-transferase CaiB-like acyl-CoA transferase